MVIDKHINLRAIDCSWSVRFNLAAKRESIQETLDELIIFLPELSSKVVSVLLVKRWLKKKAELELTPWLTRVSQRCGLNYVSVGYRGPRTRWGSCSRDGNICLNYKLLFLPPEYVEYVMIHELCHTVYFDHSEKFWCLVECYIKNWREFRKEVRRSDHFLPQWLR